jgi:hypothetical protein
MKRLVLHTNSKEWKWRRLLIRLVGTGHSYIQFGFEWESDGIVFDGYIIVNREIVDEGVNVAICNSSAIVILAKCLNVDRLQSPEDFIKSLYLNVHQSKDKLI